MDLLKKREIPREQQKYKIRLVKRSEPEDIGPGQEELTCVFLK